MKRFRRELSEADIRSIRRWRAWSICLYVVIIAALMGAGSLVPRSGDTGRSQSASIGQISAAKPTGLSARVGAE
jgi:hypothetical protein